jgi:multidrug resistance efflux pump
LFYQKAIETPGAALMATVTTVTPEEMAKLRQDFKGLGAELSAARTKIRKLEKQLSTMPAGFAQLKTAYDALSLTFGNCERFIAEPTWTAEEKCNFLKIAIAQARGQLIAEGQK